MVHTQTPNRPRWRHWLVLPIPILGAITGLVLHRAAGGSSYAGAAPAPHWRAGEYWRFSAVYGEERDDVAYRVLGTGMLGGRSVYALVVLRQDRGGTPVDVRAALVDVGDFSVLRVGRDGEVRATTRLWSFPLAGGSTYDEGIGRDGKPARARVLRAERVRAAGRDISAIRVRHDDGSDSWYAPSLGFDVRVRSAWADLQLTSHGVDPDAAVAELRRLGKEARRPGSGLQDALADTLQQLATAGFGLPTAAPASAGR